MKKFMLLLVVTQLLSGCVVWTPDNSDPYLLTTRIGSVGYTCGQGIPYTGTLCPDPGSGGQADCGDVYTREARRACISSGAGTQQYNPAGYYYGGQFVPAYPVMLWNRERIKQTSGKLVTGNEKCPVLEKPTTKNYLEPGAIDKECQFKNPEMAGKCLLSRVDELRAVQMKCTIAAQAQGKLPVDPLCSKDPGKWATIYSCLGNELISRK